jgi:hypothetical protein
MRIQLEHLNKNFPESLLTFKNTMGVALRIILEILFIVEIYIFYTLVFTECFSIFNKYSIFNTH